MFGHATHNKQNNETKFVKHFSSMETPTPKKDSTIKHATENMVLTVTTRKSKTSEKISSSMSFLFTTLGKSNPSTFNIPETSLPNLSPSVSTNTNASISELSLSSSPSMTTSKSESLSKRISTALPISSPSSSILQLHVSATTSKSESPSKGISTFASEPTPTSSTTQLPVTTGKSESPSKRIYSTSSNHSITSTTTHPSVTTSQSSYPSEKISTTSPVPSFTTTITYPSMTNSKSKHPFERLSSTSSPTSPSITELKQLITNIATSIGKQTTTLIDTRFVSTTSFTKTAGTIPASEEQLSTSSKKTIYSTTQSRLIPTQTSPLSKTYSSLRTTIKVPLPDEQKIPELKRTKPSSQVTTSVKTVTP